ncbi:TPA: hypothetical protein N0F65_005425 [Lagenidium giganteum]|uniref:Uncharacterized protein n=1 Tax=Lagenidium giganteum TaxID=4803 RepID=A0AAV2Z1U7_9STRA|nr:TPA: hypothetical protein N0F65_005425 [Lagenidium giganteum]
MKKNWIEEDDLAFLQQVNADTPFSAKHGHVMEAWDGVSSKLRALGGFSRDNFDGKKAQNRFSALLTKHSKADIASGLASGISEAYAEKRQLLDKLASLVHDYKQAELAHAAEEKR